MLEASSEIRLVFQASISTLNWTTPVLKHSGVNIAIEYRGVKSGTPFFH